MLQIISNIKIMKITNFILILFIIVQSAHYINSLTCATPCISNNACQTSVCNEKEGVCVVSAISPPPSGCCIQNDHCTSTQLCVVEQCNFESNQCESTTVCDLTSTNTVCNSDLQCPQTSRCAQVKCIDNVCQTSPLYNSEEDYCCSSSLDCPDVECTTKYCNLELFQCFYTPLAGCSNNNNNYYNNNNNNNNNNNSSSSYDAPPPTGGDIVGAVFAYTILGIMALSILLLVLFFAFRFIKRKVKKLTHKNDDVDEKPLHNPEH